MSVFSACWYCKPSIAYTGHIVRYTTWTHFATLKYYAEQATSQVTEQELFHKGFTWGLKWSEFSPSAGHRTQLLLTLSPTFRTRSTTTKQPSPHKSHSQTQGRDPLTWEGLPTLIPSLRRTPMTGGAPPHTPTQGELPLIRRGSCPQPPSHKIFCYRPAPTLPPKRTKISWDAAIPTQ